MQLDEFVKETLVQIAKGVNEASSSVSELGGAVNPLPDEVDVSFETYKVKPQKQAIKFDIAIQVKESTDSEASGKATLSVFSIGGGVKSLDESNIAHRVTFEVPMDLPS
ncbi:hypothetical protein [Vibrio sp. 10N.222.52.C12]|uniref:hypothetical protein n=1 Tax=Vibrio sp. 10N.222.52.C12 TaxID=3229630 RepID=UPI00354D4637